MKPELFHYPYPFTLESGETLPSITLAYHTYGTLNSAANNAVWICHALTANSEVSDWWPGMVGTGKPFDPTKHFIVSANIIGSCYGSTGPLSAHPETGQPWYREFPGITIRDNIRAFELLREHLGINQIHAIAGGSIGGFQALEYSIMYPELVRNLVFIASSTAISPWAVAFNQSQRLAIEADPTFAEDRPHGGIKGLKAARSMALLSYRNEAIYNQRQEEQDIEKTDGYKAASYQDYQGDKLTARFDAYSYYAITKLMDTHNIARGRGSLHSAAGKIEARVLCIGISSDLIFPTHEQKFLAHLTDGTYREIESLYGHDGFLIDTAKIGAIVSEFLEAEPARHKVDSRENLSVSWVKSA